MAATVISMLGYGPEAEDVGQETFIRFYKTLDKFRGESSPGTYLTRIAVNLSLNELKRRHRHRKFFYSKSEEKISNLPDTKGSNNHNELKKLVRWGLQKLEPKFRTVLVLRTINGYTSRETAEILDLPIGTVLSRLARGQAKLKKILVPLLWDKNEQKGEGDE